jgi:hypothetical protein
MNDLSKLNVESTIKATGSVAGLLPQIASFAVGLSGLAYITGWREASAYYNTLGAPWALSLLSTAQIMQTSIWLVSLIAIFSLISIFALTQGAASQKGLRRWSIIFMFAAALSIIGSSFLSNATANLAAGAASILWAISAGLTIGELVACLASDNLKWGEYHIHLLYFVVFFGLLYASNNMGESRANVAANVASSSLPHVLLMGAASDTQWRLVAPLNEQMLLVTLADNKKDRRFKVVNATDLNEIVSTSR